MGLRSRNKVKADFNMSSLTDIIFLLLIFFMLTSTLVSPNALKLLLPNSNSKARPNTSFSVSIDKNKNYYYNSGSKSNKAISLASLRSKMKADKQKEGGKLTVSLHAEKSVPIENVVEIMNIAYEEEIAMILATQPKK